MLGAIAGDIIGSPYERHNIKTRAFPLFGPQSRFTDDTVLTAAVAVALLGGRPYAPLYREFYARYPDAGYGERFARWARDAECGPYGSWGNGSAMRASPVGWAFERREEVLRAARESALPTHNHPEGILGAQAIALAVLLGRRGLAPRDVAAEVARETGYDLDFTLDEIRDSYRFDVSCRGSVPQALVAFRDGESYEDVIRGAISIGGDSDTIACMAGAMAEPVFGVPEPIAREALKRLDAPLRRILERFRARLVPGASGS